MSHRQRPARRPTYTADLSPAPKGSETTLTPQMVRPSSPALLMEISRDELPALATPTPAATKPRAKATKAAKGKGKVKAGTPPTKAAQGKGKVKAGTPPTKSQPLRLIFLS
jgi:hypothetical protein